MIARILPILLSLALVGASVCVTSCTNKKEDDAALSDEDLDYEDGSYEDDEEESSGNVIKDYVNTPKNKANAVAEKLEQRYRDMGVDKGLDDE